MSDLGIGIGLIFGVTIWPLTKFKGEVYGAEAGVPLQGAVALQCLEGFRVHLQGLLHLRQEAFKIQPLERF